MDGYISYTTADLTSKSRVRHRGKMKSKTGVSIKFTREICGKSTTFVRDSEVNGSDASYVSDSVFQTPGMVGVKFSEHEYAYKRVQGE